MNLTRVQNTQNTKHIIILNIEYTKTDINDLENDRFAFHSSSLFKHAFTRDADQTHVTKRGHFRTQFLMFKQQKTKFAVKYYW